MLKIKNKTDENTEVVYKIECNDCNISYIGETKKQLKDLVKQHEAIVRNKINLSLVYQPVAQLLRRQSFSKIKAGKTEKVA